MSDPHDPAEIRRRALSFDKQAEQYDAARPGYPSELGEAVLAYAGARPGDALLEIGAGTGKATQLFAGRGYQITCVEPGENMAAVAQRKFAGDPGVYFEITSFEDWQTQPERFTLAYAAQAFHWVQAEKGYAQIFAALKPHGALALFWNRPADAGTALFEEMQAVYAPFEPLFYNETLSLEDEIREMTASIHASGLFTPVEVRRFPWTRRFSLPQYLDLVSTYSDHAALPPDARAALFDGLAGLFGRHAGTIERGYQAIAYLAPAMHYAQIIDGTFLKGVGIDKLWLSVVSLLIYAFVLFTIAHHLFTKRPQE
jgi:SAM-dependent methyltransferase